MFVALLAQLLLIVSFLMFGWQADQAMEQSGNGDLDAWNRLNSYAGMVFYSVVLIWLSSIVLSVAGNEFRSIPAQIAIGLQPLVLVLGWCLLWFV